MHIHTKPQPISLISGESCFGDFTTLFGDLTHEQTFMFNGILLGICTHGTLLFQINYHKYQLQENEVFILLPHHLFTILHHSNDLKLITLHLPSNFLLTLPTSPNFDLIKRITQSPCIHMDTPNMKNIYTLSDIIEKYANKSHNSYKPIQYSLTLSIAMIIASQIEQQPVYEDSNMSRQDKLTREFFNLLLAHYKDQRNLSFYASALYITSKYLSTAIRKETGYPAQHWINEMTLIEAKRQLKTTACTIQQISEELHFPTSSSFIRFFRQHTGITPLKYRKEE